MRNLITLFFLSSVALNSWALTELKTLENLEPLPGPDARNIGWEWHFTDQDGKPGHMRKIAGDDLVATYERTDGCRWTRATTGFAPATEWSNCPSTGTSSVKVSSGSIWPIELGKRIEYTVKGTSSLIGRAWTTKRTCEVTKAIRIRIRSGEYDTFKVECKERWGTRTWWLAPSVGTAVAYQQKTRRGGFVLQEMDRIVSP